MIIMKKIFGILAVALTLVSCAGSSGDGKGRKALLPNVSGKAGEVIVVLDKADWEGNFGNDIREILAGDCPFLPVQEPLYNLVNVIPSAFGDLFKVHRNIVYIVIDPQNAKTGVSYMQDVWASPQCVIQISAYDAQQAQELFVADSAKIINAIEQAERDRVISNSILYEEKALAIQVNEIFGGSPHFPTGYKLKKKTDDFVWIADEKQYTNQAVLVYSYPASGVGDELSLENIIAKRNEILKENIPGMFPNTWMTTGSIPQPTVEYLKYRGRSFAQTRGWWEVENDYMGGPFVSHSFYSEDGSKVIVTEAFVYAPKYDKRQYLRQVESILYSWEWKKEE